MSRYMNRPENALKRANGKLIGQIKCKNLVVNGFKMDAAPLSLNTATTLADFHHNPKTCGKFCRRFSFNAAL